ncbi:MAG: hypothetical protein EXS36_08775 [Pedosphaera sp.]|nr:hypothetical protein [Pedosphaera sp.]
MNLPHPPNSRPVARIAGLLALITLQQLVPAADLVKAKSGSGVYGYKAVFHNGVLVYDNQVIHGAIGHRVLPDPTKAVAKGPIRLGGHGFPVAFRTLWIRPLADWAAWLLRH